MRDTPTEYARELATERRALGLRCPVPWCDAPPDEPCWERPADSPTPKPHSPRRFLAVSA
jgi:hypothetical protein